jgi:hypothetical protein
MPQKEYNKEMITSFKQTAAGNCVSIAVIKAGIEVFGIGGLFNHRIIEDKHHIIMLDGKELVLEQSEVDFANQNSGFEAISNQEIYEYAQLCYAVMAKRAQRDGNDNYGPGEATYEQALNTLNDGEHYLEGPNWLGLRYHTVPVGKRYRWRYTACIANSPKHCFYMSYGYEDEYGSPDWTGGLWDRIRVRHVIRIVDKPIYDV